MAKRTKGKKNVGFRAMDNSGQQARHREISHKGGVKSGEQRSNAAKWARENPIFEAED